MRTVPIPSIEGALAREDGRIKFPNCEAAMPNGGMRVYRTKWVLGVKMRASKKARHEYYGSRYRGRTYKVHRLICEAFHGPPPPGMSIVIHKNENALDNRPDNLRWGTQKENLNMPGFIAYCRGRTGDDNPWAKHRAKKAGN